MASILTKAGFAAQLGVSRSRISQWISAKQIYGDALVGEGRTARIRVVTACAQLKKTLDISQRLANGRAKLNDPGTAADATSTSDVTIEDQIKAERLLPSKWGASALGCSTLLKAGKARSRRSSRVNSTCPIARCRIL
jgi:hypothetical protein